MVGGTNCLDEIGLIVDESTIDLELERNRERRQQDMLPIDKVGQTTKVRLERVDQKLLDVELRPGCKARVIHFEEIMGRVRRRGWRKPVAMFSAFDAFSSEDVYALRYCRDERGNFSRVGSQVGVYCPDGARNKIFSALKDWESQALVRKMVITGLTTAVILFAVLFALMPPWVTALVSIFGGSSASTIMCIIPWTTADLVLGIRKASNVPGDVTAGIKKVKHLFDSILIVEEADPNAWSQKAIAKPKARDPLVIAVKNDVFYLLDRYDVTPDEEYVAREFTEG